MNILYDNQIFKSQRYGGISRYFFELITNLKKYKDVNITLPLLYSSNYLMNEKGLSKYFDLLEDKKFKGKGRLFDFLSKIDRQKNIKALKKQNFDIFHPTYYDPYFLKFIGKKPFVLTIHDMIHEIYPQYFPEEDKTAENKKNLITKAARIIAVSNNTKNDICKFYGINKNKIDIIYHGSSLNINKVEKFNVKLPKRYILFVGDRWIYKNFIFFIKSLSSLLNNDRDLKVVCAGSINFSKEEKSLFKKLNVENQIFHYSIKNNNILAYLYKNALVFAFPSLYEGFGIPILEAFSCSCPAVISNSSSFPEVAENAACYFDSTDKESIKTAVEKVIYDEKLRKNLIKKGLKRIKFFSWQKTAKKTKEIYEKII